VTRTRQPATPRQGQSPVRLHIENLVLHGFASADRGRIADGVQSELARLLTDGRAMAFPKKPSVLEHSDGGAIRIGAGEGPQATGRQIAEAIYRSLQKSGAASNDSREATERESQR